jgi:hypothetical protein
MADLADSEAHYVLIGKGKPRMMRTSEEVKRLFQGSQDDLD